MGDLVWLTWFQSNKALYAACKFVHDYVDKFVQRALQHRHHANVAHGDEKGKAKYIFANELAQVTDDPLRIRTELLNILLAGRDTTAGLLSNTFHVLARRPDIWAKLAQEVNELGGRKPDYETLRSMKYLKRVLNESKSIVRRHDLSAGMCFILMSLSPQPFVCILRCPSMYVSPTRTPSSRPVVDPTANHLSSSRKATRLPILYIPCTAERTSSVKMRRSTDPSDGRRFVPGGNIFLSTAGRGFASASSLPLLKLATRL